MSAGTIGADKNALKNILVCPTSIIKRDTHQITEELSTIFNNEPECN